MNCLHPFDWILDLTESKLSDRISNVCQRRLKTHVVYDCLSNELFVVPCETPTCQLNYVPKPSGMKFLENKCVTANSQWHKKTFTWSCAAKRFRLSGHRRHRCVTVPVRTEVNGCRGSKGHFNLPDSTVLDKSWNAPSCGLKIRFTLNI